MPSVTFDYTGSQQKFVVPADVKVITVRLTGGGTASQAGRVVGRVRVEPGQTFFVAVGRQGFFASGKDGGAVAFGGGGAGGNGSPGRAGGRGGGGATILRRNSRTGLIIAVAGGAGGNAGDGDGGRGGTTIGEEGSPSTNGTGTTYPASGGTQNQGGKGGTSLAGSAFGGRDAVDARVARGGRGGGLIGAATTPSPIFGGGGGGGGWFPGGGGQAGSPGNFPAGGGAGGSNCTGGLYSITQGRNGGTGHGQAVISWNDPDGNLPPSPPTDIKIGGVPIVDGLATKAVGSVLLSGIPDDPDTGQDVRLLVQISKNSSMAGFSRELGTYDPQEKRDFVWLRGLENNTRYYLRIYTQDHTGKRSMNYRSTNFWTNRRPDPPTLTSPAENGQFPVGLNMTFTWNHVDPDPSDPQTAFQFRYRNAGSALHDPGPWTTTGVEVTSVASWVVSGDTFKGSNFYEWQVRTRDGAHHWGPWSLLRSFYALASSAPPRLQVPTSDSAIVAADAMIFRWQFLTPLQGVTQSKADLRWRVYGGTEMDWNLILGDTTTPGGDPFYEIPADTFAPNTRYEWAARTTSSGGVTSDWSDPATFWATAAPGSGAGIVVVDSGRPQDPLGSGENRVFVFDRGGQVFRGEITPTVSVDWGRKRDDLSSCIVRVNSWDTAGKAFLGRLRTWMHELVVFRDGKRVWEGPVTRISGDSKQLEIEAKDVMGYVYRRIMRQGYNDAYRLEVGGVQLGLNTVVHRSAQIILNALAYDDPNVLPYLTALPHALDARNSRVVPDYSRTAWEEVDDLAATAGLDYTAVGRRIVLWDTHRPLGRLPELRDGDFSESPIVTEYGMAMANYYAVTNNNGIWGAASLGVVDGDPGPTGWIEQLASAYGESEGAGTEQTLTREAIKELRATLREQARRNISPRSPAPVVVRIPDNSFLSPDLNIGINQLVPGVWVPLRATNTVREVAQWQKLDSMRVVQDAAGEKISVVLSPAPNEGEDPDAEQALLEEG